MRGRFFAAILIFLAAIPDASAQFKATPKEFPIGVICGILNVEPRERNEDDPVMMIYVAPTFDDKRSLESLSVTHTTVFGQSFTRSDQYSNDYLAQMPGKLEINWRGTLKRNTSVRMNGRFWNDSRNGRWYYSEFIEDSGRPRMRLFAGCHAAGPD